MSYQVIARKYRPQRFADVVGQEHVTQTLANAIQQNRIAHAYLFVGPRGTGKTTLARIFAKCLNCTDGPKVDFAQDDPRCQEIAEGRSLDVLEIDGASNRGIEEVRELRETVKYAPATSRFKIYIIDEVHMLTKEAFNALLKTLEEPPAHVKFMFATTEPEKVLPTILSRCQRFDLRRIPTGLIVQHLRQIAQLEKVQVEDAALYAIARGAEGGMRDAQSALDQLISFCGDKIVEADVLSMFGLSSRGQVLSLAAAIVSADAQGALAALDALARQGKDLARLLGDLLNHFRNLLLFQVSGGDTALLDVPETEAAALAEQVKELNTEVLTRIMDLLSEYEGRLRDAASKRILIEVALLKALQARSTMSVDAVLQKLQALRGGEGSTPPSFSAPSSGTGAKPAAKPADNPAAAPAERSPKTPASAAPVAPAVKAAPASSPGPLPASAQAPELSDVWAKLLDAVGRVSTFARSYLLLAHPVSLTRTALTIGFDPLHSDQMSLSDNQKNRALLQSKLEELGCPGVQVRIIQAAAPEGWTPPETAVAARAASAPAAAAARAGNTAEATTPNPSTAAATAPIGAPVEAKAAKPVALSKDDFKNDPLIKQALEIFKGQIVEVRT